MKNEFLNKFKKSNKLIQIKPINSEENQGKNKQKKLNFFENISNDVKISVEVEFLANQDNKELGNLYIWSYKINIQNLRDKKIKLQTRHFKIYDQKGNVQQVDGDGVIGKQPEISSFDNFEYSSGLHLTSPEGVMSGYYIMQDENGEFKANLPSFSLSANFNNLSVN